MDELKQDLRVRHTKQLLKDALLKILQDKSIDKVTVTELCKEAHINRNTFYSHYRSPGDLLKEVEKNFADKLMSEVSEPFQNNNYETMLKKICRAIYEDRDLAQVFVNKNGTGQFIDEIIQAFRVLMLQAWTDTNASQEKLNTLYEYGVGGSYTLLRNWVEGNFHRSPDQMAEELLQLNLAVLYGYLGGQEPSTE